MAEGSLVWTHFRYHRNVDNLEGQIEMKNRELRHSDVRFKEAGKKVCYTKLCTCNLACIQGIQMQFNIQCTHIHI